MIPLSFISSRQLDSIVLYRSKSESILKVIIETALSNCTKTKDKERLDPNEALNFLRCYFLKKLCLASFHTSEIMIGIGLHVSVVNISVHMGFVSPSVCLELILISNTKSSLPIIKPYAWKHF